MLKIAGLNQYYGESHTLWDMDVEIPEGQCTCVMGRNGVGKTTLMQCIMGLLPPRSGSMAYLGHDLARLPAEKRAELGIGFVPQGRQIFPLLTVEENLQVAYAGLAAADRSVPDDVFELFPMLKDMLGRRGGDLSGGQQQQLAIGRALVTRPRLLMLDEPTEGIQPSIIKDIGRAIEFLRERGDMAIVLVEQYFDFAEAIADRYCVLDRGEVVVEGVRADVDPEEVRRHLTV